MQCIAGAKHGGAEAFFTRLVLALHRAGLDQRVVLAPSFAAQIRTQSTPKEHVLQLAKILADTRKMTYGI